MSTEPATTALEDAAVRCQICGSIEVFVVDTSKTKRGTYHGAVCVNGHALILLTKLVRMAKSPRVRYRFPSDLSTGDDSAKPLTGR
jgi:hypothetical protein